MDTLKAYIPFMTPKDKYLTCIVIDDSILKKVNKLIKRDTFIAYCGGFLLLVNIIRNLYLYYTIHETLGITIITWILNIFNALIALLQFHAKSKNYTGLKERLIEWFDIALTVERLPEGDLKKLYMRDKKKLEGSILEFVNKRNLGYLIDDSGSEI